MDIYAYQKPLGKIEDVPDLKKDFIKVYEEKTHQEVVRFCQVYAAYLSELTAFAFTKEMKEALTAMDDWLAGESSYHAARNLSFEISRLAKGEEDIIKVKFYRTMAQLVASPHVKYHGLWAADFAITLINKMYPGDFDAVKKERLKQIELLKTT
jgi:hypothetical protein